MSILILISFNSSKSLVTNIESDPTLFLADCADSDEDLPEA